MKSSSPPMGPRRWSRKGWGRNPARPKRLPNASAATSRSGGASRSRLASAPSNTLTDEPTGSRSALIMPQRKTALAIGPDGQKTRSPLWPEHALIGSHHVADALVDEFLQAFALPSFGRVEVALGIGRDAVSAVELAVMRTDVVESDNLIERTTQDTATDVTVVVGE